MLMVGGIGKGVCRASASALFYSVILLLEHKIEVSLGQDRNANAAMTANRTNGPFNHGTTNVPCQIPHLSSLEAAVSLLPLLQMP